MELNLSFHTIGYEEPTLWIVVALSCLLSFGVGWLLAKWIVGRARPPSRRAAVVLASMAAIPVVYIGSILLLHVVHAATHDGATTCTAYVTPVFLLPALAAALGAARLRNN